jgi:bifunctional non-homologous end joining protein LigD
MNAATVTRPPRRVRSSTVNVSNVDKALFPSGFTKGQMVDYYERVSHVLLPHLKGRALTLKRYPNGSDQPFFFEKNCPVHRPDWVDTARVRGRSNGDSVNHCVVGTRDGLRWVANLASIELHVPLSRADKPDIARAMAFDLDPGPGVTLLECAKLALRVRSLLGDVGLESFPKTSGGKGFHVYVPLNRDATFDDTKSFAKTVADAFQKDDPTRVTATMTKSHRAGKIFVDWSQNDRHKTTVCVYSLRARDVPSVSTPMTWDEVETAVVEGDEDAMRFEAADVLKRVEHFGDLFKPVLEVRQRLPR